MRPQRETKLQMVVKWEYFEEFVRVENSYDYRLLQKNSRDVMVGVERIATILKYERILDHLLVGITTIVVIPVQTVWTKNCDHLRSQTVGILTRYWTELKFFPELLYRRVWIDNQIGWWMRYQIHISVRCIVPVHHPKP